MKKKLMTLIFILIMTLGLIVNVHAATPSANSLTLKVIEKDIKEIYGGMKNGYIEVSKKALYNYNGYIHS